MRIFILTLALTLFLNSGCYPQENQNLNHYYDWDFGKVKEGAVVKHNFILKNNSETPLFIERLQTSCGCTASSSSSNTIKPGKTAKISVKFNTRGYSGKTEQFVYVHTNDIKSPIVKLTIKAEVVK